MRKSYLDNIRWMTVVLVVFYHVLYMYNSVIPTGVVGPLAGTVQIWDVLLYMVYPWFMVLLFAVSGMAARYSLERHSGRAFLRRRTVKLLVPSTVGLLVFQWILGYFNMGLGGAFEQMGALPKPVLYLIMCVSGTGPLWYIQLLWLYSVVLVALHRVERGRLLKLGARANVPVLLLLTVLIWGSAQVLNVPVILVYRCGIYGVAFFIGYFVLSHEAVQERLQRAWLPLTAAALVLMGAFCVVYWQKPYAEHSVLDTPLCNAFAWIAVLAILAVMGRFGRWDNRLTRYLNRQAWGLYIFHYLPLAAAAWYLQKWGVRSPAAVYILTTLAAFFGAWLLDAVVGRIPVLRWCVLGIKGKKEKDSAER